jgi:hypothetical protein
MLVEVLGCLDGAGNERREEFAVGGANGTGGGRQASGVSTYT